MPYTTPQLGQERKKKSYRDRVYHRDSQGCFLAGPPSETLQSNQPTGNPAPDTLMLSDLELSPLTSTLPSLSSAAPSMNSSLIPSPLFSRRNNKDVQVFLQCIQQAFFELTAPADNKAQIEWFECNLELSSRADRWFKELPANKKDKWTNLKTAFLEKWPPPEVAEDDREEALRELKELVLREEEIGMKKKWRSRTIADPKRQLCELQLAQWGHPRARWSSLPPHEPANWPQNLSDCAHRGQDRARKHLRAASTNASCAAPKHMAVRRREVLECVAPALEDEKDGKASDVHSNSTVVMMYSQPPIQYCDLY